MEGTGAPQEARSRPDPVGHQSAATFRPGTQACRTVGIAAALALAALLAFGVLAEEVRQRGTFALDALVRTLVLAHRAPLLLTVFRWITTVGSVTPMVAYALVAAALLALRGRHLAAIAALVAPVGAVVAYLGLKNVFARNRPTGIGNVIEGTYSFPSAHATTSAAICCTLAYLLWREGLLPPAPAVGIAVVVPGLVGASRVVLDVHWATDVLGGWLAGLCIAAVCAALYQAIRQVHGRSPSRAVST